MSYSQRNTVVEFANHVDLDEVAHKVTPQVELLIALWSLNSQYKKSLGDLFF